MRPLVIKTNYQKFKSSINSSILNPTKMCNLLLSPLLTVIDHHLVILSTCDQPQTVITEVKEVDSFLSVKTSAYCEVRQALLIQLHLGWKTNIFLKCLTLTV